MYAFSGLFKNKATVLGNIILGDASTTNLRGRISTVTEAGSAITVPDTYTYGEAIELRYTFAETGNSQRQGLFMDIRTSAANSSTVRGCEVTAQQEGAIAVGVLSGGTFKAITRSATTGNITNMYGLEAEITHNSSAYTGTITEAAVIRGKFSPEDGATYTKSSVFLADAEPVSGADVLDAYYRAKSHANVSATSALDVADAVLVETNSGKNVTLIRFTGANGSVYRLVHDTDAATAVSVVTD